MCGYCEILRSYYECLKTPTICPAEEAVVIDLLSETEVITQCYQGKLNGYSFCEYLDYNHI